MEKIRKVNPWFEHVKKVRDSKEAKGLKQSEIIKLAKKTYNKEDKK